MKRLSSKVMRTAPKRIWLQCGDDPEASRCNFSELAEVTWSADEATHVCIEYVRADLVRDAMMKAEAALADIGDADREPGDDLAWCERRAAQALPEIRAALDMTANT